MTNSTQHESARKRGRPRSYSPEDRRRIAEIIRQCGARGAREQLGNTICMSTLLGIAREFGIELKRGRRRVA